MYFQSFEYLFCFLPIMWIGYFLTRRTNLRQVVLIIGGYLFYAWGQPWIAWLLFASTSVDFLIGLAMQSTEGIARRRMLLAASLVFNLGLLAVFKYSGWIFAGINALLTSTHITAHRLPVLDLPLPPGISFYTFQSLAYIIDIYRRKIHAHRKALDYYAFVAFFPQLFAGPIERAGQLLPQIVHPPRIHPRMFETGIFMIVWGLFKKLVVADNMAGLIELTRDHMAVPGATMVLFLAFTFQIYGDFSGYTDIARGSARLLGIKLRRNFLTPYFARNPSDFWQRWHISLSSWMRDYLYISLGGSRQGRLRTLFNLLVTMFLVGLWHGAGKYFIFWGLYHGTLLVLYRVFPIDDWLEKRLKTIGTALSRLVMFAFVAFGWGLFYAGSHGNFKHLFFPSDLPPDAFQGSILWYGLFLFGLPLLVTETLAFRKHREFTDLWPHYSTWLKALVLLVLFYGIIFFGARDSHEFIYFKF